MSDTVTTYELWIERGRLYRLLPSLRDIIAGVKPRTKWIRVRWYGNHVELYPSLLASDAPPYVKFSPATDIDAKWFDWTKGPDDE